MLPLGLCLLRHAGILAVVALATGCEPPVAVRVYDAPKSDSEFVSGPNAGGPPLARRPPGMSASPSSGPRRILGAVIPLESGCYFLKGTDSPERMQPVMTDFYTLVAEFAINPSSGKPDMKLPEGWTMVPRNDIAMAEFVAPASLGNVKFTVTVLEMPPADQWQPYLLSNINRWRGQLNLQEIDAPALQENLVSVDRPGSLLPGYIFDAVGNGTGGMSSGPRSAPVTPPSTSSSQPVSSPQSPPVTQQTPSSSSNRAGASGASVAEGSSERKPELRYDLPTGWKSAAGSPFRLATFAIASEFGEGEVTVSMAVENPLNNSMMWFQQVMREGDEETLRKKAESAIAGAQKVPVAKGEATLYTIQSSEQKDAPMLLVASLPSDSPELHVFVKLRGSVALVESQRTQFQQFVQSLTLQ